MKKFTACCFTGQVSNKNRHSKQNHSLERIEGSSEISMGNIVKNDVADNSQIEEQNMISPSDNTINVENVIQNHDFSEGLHSWQANSCVAAVVPSGASNVKVAAAAAAAAIPAGGGYAVVTNRTECWQGLEQDITDKVSAGSEYSVSACVGVSHSEPADVLATLKLEHEDSNTSYLTVGRISVTKDKWVSLDGTFSLSKVPKRVVFYLEGPSPGVDLLIKSVVMRLRSAKASEIVGEDMGSSSSNSHSTNILQNHDFSQGLQSWYANHCSAFVVPSYASNSEEPGNFVILVKRNNCWNGLEQEITAKISEGSTYSVSARVGVSGGHLMGSSDIKATLRLEFGHLQTNYVSIGRASATKDEWLNLHGTFSLSKMPKRVVFFLEGPSPGVDLLIKSVAIMSTSPKPSETEREPCISIGDENVILNPNFEDGLNNWSGRGCKIVLHDSMGDGKIVPQSGKYFAAATERTQNWNGIQQEITGRVQRKLAYELIAVARIFGNNVANSDLRATLWVQTPDQREQYIGIANVQATDKDWALLQGKFLLNNSPSRVVVYLEGPPPGTDILLNSLVVKHAEKTPPLPPPVIENPGYGINILENSNLTSGTNGWFSLGNCALGVKVGSPHILPPAARDTLGPHEALSGRLMHVTNRTQTWMGPAQMITDKIKLFLTYQVSGWVRVSSGATGPHNVNVALGVDSQWVNGGQVEIHDDRWHEISGSFRIEKQPAKVMIYVQGPAAGVDFMLAGLQIFPVDREARFKHLKRQTDLIRKRDIIVKLAGADPGSISAAFVKIKQAKNSFPIGSCISRSNIDNEDFVKFFVENFNWAVFGNELKWYWTEAQQGKLNYKDSDELLDFCQKNGVEARGHCIFWEVEATVQQWIRSLNKADLAVAVQSRLTSLLGRYKGKFRHYDVNNEMLHGSFYQDRLGSDARANMFKSASQLDPLPLLFVNDYHVEDGCDPKSSPDKYVDHIVGLMEQGAPVGGIGIQGHIDGPVGPLISSALDKLGVLGLPIWFTELDVSSVNEHVRADDLEAMLREAYAHPAVEGVMLWGFWELFMSRENSHLVDAEGEVNEAGKRYLRLKKEWLSHAHGHVGGDGEFRFRGFHGTYAMEVVIGSKKVFKTFVVDKADDDSPLVVSIDL